MLDALSTSVPAQAPPPIHDDHQKVDGTAREQPMKEFVYGGVGKNSLLDRPKPRIGLPGDAFVRMVKTTICSTDLHSRKGDVAIRALGRRSDRVLIAGISSYGKCKYCRRGMYSHCWTGGRILGNEIDGGKAEYVRIPHAETGPYPNPEEADEYAIVMLSYVLPTGFERGMLNGKAAPGSTVVAIAEVGIPTTFEICEKIGASGGAIANIGVHGRKVDLHPEILCAHDMVEGAADIEALKVIVDA